MRLLMAAYFAAERKKPQSTNRRNWKQLMYLCIFMLMSMVDCAELED